MAGPPPPAYSVSWQLFGSIEDRGRWALGWHLSTPGASGYDYASVHRLHEDCLLLAVLVFNELLASGVTLDLSRFTATGPASSIGDHLQTVCDGARGRCMSTPTAVPVRQIIQASGRGQDGRFFLPPPAESDCDFSDQLSPSAHSTYSALLTDLFNEVNTLSDPGFPSVRFAVIHRRQNGAYLPVAQVRPVDTWQIRGKLGTQVRRLRRVRIA